MVTTLTEKRFFEWHEDDKSVTLRNKSGSYGGGSEVLVVLTNVAASAQGISKVSETNMSTKES